MQAAGPHRDASLLVEAKGIGVWRSGRWLVRDISLDVRRGEIVSLIGPNGGGKTTTAKALVGIHTIDAGSVFRPPGTVVAYVPQKLSVEASLPLSVRRLMTLTGRRPRAMVNDALETVGIAHLADEAIHTLSGGELQRAHLARAMLRHPDLLVLDEPAQGVDALGEIALYGLIKDIRDRMNCGVILISHDLHVVMGETDRVICLNGHVCCAGTPRLVAESPAYRDLFGSRAANALAVYRHHHDHSHDHAPAGIAACGHDHHDHPPTRQPDPDREHGHA